jgi:hypothetical protein
MRRIHSLLLVVFLLVPIMFLSNPAQAMPISQMETIVANARGAVDTALAQLQSALITGDLQTVQLAQQALDLAISNYAIASETLEKARNGTQPPSSNPGDIPAGLSDIEAQILAASAESASILAGGGTSPGTAESLGTNTASPI